MDRFALAIQEILKTYKISPEKTSSGHRLWNTLSEAQKQLMLPLLSSKYTITQPLEHVNISPIYGSRFGLTYESWLHKYEKYQQCYLGHILRGQFYFRWALTLITSLNEETSQLLQACLLGLQQDNRVFMLFLPHILLHALLDNKEDIHESAYLEILAVINSSSSKPHSEVCTYSQ